MKTLHMRIGICVVLGLTLAASSGLRAAEADKPPAWATAHLAGKPMTATQTKALMMRLARYVFDHHLKKDPKSPQRGMVYEHFDVTREGKGDQWVQGEALDTMHDGAWFAAAMVNASRATGDRFYKDFLTKWQMPFYCKMLNHSDELFVSSAGRNDARKGALPWGKGWAFQDGEKGFIPYFWDDGASVSLDRLHDKNPLGIRPCVDLLAGKPNPLGRLDGYSQGMSNHMAQDIGVMVQLAWLLLRRSEGPADKRLAAEIADAAANLHACRMRHHGFIPMCGAPAALARGDEALMRRVPDPADKRLWTPANHYTHALRDFAPGKRMSFPGFADNSQYRFYYSIARGGGKLPEPMAFKLVYDAYTEPLLYHYYSDDAPVPPGINKADLYPLYAVDGKPAGYRSDRKGPHRTAWPVGCRMGPQNMVVCGWALQALRQYPGIWERRYRRDFAGDLRVCVGPSAKAAPPAKVELGNAALKLSATRHELLLAATCKGDQATIEIFAAPDAKGRPAAVITAGKDGTLAAAGADGQKLTLHGKPKPADGGFTLDVALPFTVVKGQKSWATFVEHGRYSIRVGLAQRNLYVASRADQVVAWLARELGCGLRTWEALFAKVGYLPVAVGSKRNWGRFSDSGGYAHLISAAAQWLLYLDGKSDWQTLNVPAVPKASHPAQRASPPATQPLTARGGTPAPRLTRSSEAVRSLARIACPRVLASLTSAKGRCAEQHFLRSER